ncbi:FAD-dependent oxidoreductase [Dankookia sp. GCM10030260]|uniref:FAD-dependent oxidoreductase n=1 Tax=Dankookia sp. GCM10030260 TaxID=3273390 RepID=UPI00360F3EDB
MRIGIIGTGVAGSVLAEMLAGAPGITVQAFDRMSEGEAAEAGTGLNVGPNAMQALRIGLPARHAAVRAASLPWSLWFIDTAWGERLFDLDMLDVAAEPGIRLRWSELYGVLRAPVAGVTRRGLVLEALEEDAAGRLAPVLRDAAGGLHRPGGFDLLVAGDGRYSRLRQLAAGVPVPRLHGVALTRLLVPDAADCPYDDYGQWFNGHARLLSYRLPGGAAYIAGGVPLADAAAEVPEAARTADYQAALYLPADRPACPAVAWMVGCIRRQIGELHWARLQDSPLLRGALDGRVLFLGDAAHAMVPTLGQGATQAIEDGVVAGAVLRRGGGVAEIGALRDARVEFVREFSLDSTDTMLPGSDPIGDSRGKMAAEYLAKLRRLYTEIPGL